jgi:DNA-binding winged helix-turn-helix (wHTH) protein
MSEAAPKVPLAHRNSAAISPQSPIYRVAGVEVDTSRARTTVGGEPVTMRNKTYRVLLFLLERPDRIVSREELIEGVWNGTAVSDDVLIRCVAELRKVFGDDPKNPAVLKTFPRMGYGIIAPVTLASPVEPKITPEARPLAPERPKYQRYLLVGAAVVFACGICAAFALWTIQRAVQADEPPFFEAAWWPLNEGSGNKVSDESGRVPQGNVAGPVRWVEGRLGGALRLSTPDSIVSGQNAGRLPDAGMARTISAWVRMFEPRVDGAVVFEYGSSFRGPTRRRMTLAMNRDGRFSFGSALEGGYVVTPTAWTDAAWHLVTGVYGEPASDTISLYVDGHLENRQKAGVTPATLRQGEWSIGRGLLGGPGFRGDVDDVRVYAWGMNAAKVQALFRCSAGIRDLGAYYYLPVFYHDLVIRDRIQGESSAGIRNDGKDFAGIQLAAAGGNCGLRQLYGADVGQDLRISAEYLVPDDAAGHITQAGPYFRTRRGMGGDGLIGGTSAGYWVLLQSNGMVRVRCLNPNAVVAFSKPDADFDPRRFHRMEVEVLGEFLRVRVDEKATSFDLGTSISEQVPLPPVWQNHLIGKNQGAAGIAFGAEDNRGAIGGQEARNIEIRKLGEPH